MHVKSSQFLKSFLKYFTIIKSLKRKKSHIHRWGHIASPWYSFNHKLWYSAISEFNNLYFYMCDK